MDYQEALSEHNKRMRTDPMYRMLEHMEDSRVDMIPGQWSNPITEVEPVVTQKHIYFKMDRGAFELNRRVNELENSNKYLIRKLKGLTANASKRNTNRYKYK